MMRYYWETIEACVPPDEILSALRNSGFKEVEAQSRTRCLQRLPSESVNGASKTKPTIPAHSEPQPKVAKKHKEIFVRILIISIMSLSLSACAFGHSFRYNNITANLPKTEATTIAVATLDKRPYIVDQDSDPSYAGMTRGGYGNPFSAYTQSGKPLADEMTGILVRSLEENGVKATSITTNFQENATQVTRQAGGNRLRTLAAFDAAQLAIRHNEQHLVGVRHHA